MLCSDPSLAISRRKLLILSFIMFISLKLEQMIDFVLSVSLKRRAQKKDKRERERVSERREKRERERERGGDNALYPVLHLSLQLSFLLQSEVIKEYYVRLP